MGSKCTSSPYFMLLRPSRSLIRYRAHWQRRAASHGPGIAGIQGGSGERESSPAPQSLQTNWRRTFDSGKGPATNVTGLDGAWLQTEFLYCPRSRAVPYARKQFGRATSVTGEFADARSSLRALEIIPHRY